MEPDDKSAPRSASRRRFRLDAGQTLGPYRIVAALGDGGMGEIYRAIDTRLGREVALKILHRGGGDVSGVNLALAREAQAVSNLNHPNICTLHDIARDHDIDYLVMEFVEGQSLAERLSQGPLPYPDLVRIAIEIAAALDYAHGQGVIHRDLKPGNIMLTARGAKLVDFGLARLHELEEDNLRDAAGAAEDGSRTRAGAVAGTPQYMAPEQIARGRVDARADIFALGAVIFEIATGRKALEGAGRVPELAMIPAALKPLVGRCLETAPRERWQSAAEVIDELKRIELHPPGTRWKMVTSIGASVIAAAAGAWALRAIQGTQPAAPEQVLYNFTGQNGDGANPWGSVIRGKNGSLYGVTQRGGALGKGTIYELKPPGVPGNRWTETVLYTFTGGRDGTEPLPSLTLAPQGALYGVTEFGGAFNLGTVFKLDPPSVLGERWTHRVLRSFSAKNGDGGGPVPGVTVGKHGELYVVTAYGGIPLEDGRGAVVQLWPPSDPGGAWQEKVLYRFTGANGDGFEPYSKVEIGVDGAIYGTTFKGSSGPGTVYKLSPPADLDGDWTETILHQFTGAHGDGGSPVGDVVFGRDGELFGTTQWGGKSDNGTVFELKQPPSPNAEWTYLVAYRFTSQMGDGAEPTSGLAQGEDGSLFGTTLKGGTWGNGAVYRLTPSNGAWTETVLHSFSGNQGDGAIPRCSGALVLDDGALYGATEVGGTFNVGTVFKLTTPKKR